ncbi:mechanosensitive ion channel family protein [Pontibacter sp. BT310]|uniref:Mechanosensitive ion channel family protein n=1 Tax=Pontibacter populi TaxID=890055 RepID=A0ABS6XGN1_9BACT|nr:MULTISPECIES: mechanosensitive ion channel family protein [Pontibacter]MBJ6119481.1 mechanosensitive ion channel family protein [Pontibacter sp. BT310]MBR0571909.1 mechanosensitive ion channel family protein [Microvirga sp. STS03]MBW3366335.1 mechanosensitive ion channel family protein [Pontibacter populi]
MNDILDRIYFNNTVQEYLIVLGFILLGSLLITVFRKSVLTRLRRWTESTHTRFDNFVVNSFSRFGIPILHFIVIYAGISYLNLSPKAERILTVATTVAITFMVIRLITSTLILLVRSYIKRRYPDKPHVNEIGAIGLIINLVIWGIGLGFLFDNMGYDLTAIIAGLGIGGIAVALAAQNILGDLFNYFVIFLDRPFEVGDSIAVGDKNGTIEHIGVKTTRLRSLTGEQLIISNSDLTSSRIHNYKRQQRRRVEFTLGVAYETSIDNLKAIPDLLKKIITAHELVELDRAHFASYGESALNFAVVYNVLTSDFAKHMDIKQAINLSIFQEFQERGIEFAYPTRKLFVVNPQLEEEKAAQRYSP